MFSGTSKEATGSIYLDDTETEPTVRTDDNSIERRRKIFEDDCDDDGLAWDTAVVVDEDRYRRNRPPSWMATSLSCLVCV
jgi:hypothetical protein